MTGTAVVEPMPEPAAGQAVFLYGTLMAGSPAHEALGLPSLLAYVGPATVRGTLYDLGAYPGLALDGIRPVERELHRVTAERAFETLDEHEGYDPDRSTGSRYRRVYVRLAAPATEAWVYVYDRSVEAATRIDSGSWRAYSGGSADPSRE